MPHRKTRLIAWGVILALAAFQAYANRYAISPDGVSYLDLSDAVVSGRLGDIVNLYWSPLYPLLVGMARASIGAGPQTEVAAMHATNFLCFAAMLAAFDYFVIQGFRSSARLRGTLLRGARGTASAYGLFGAVALTMTPLELTTPDWLSNAAIFLAAGALLRLHDPAWVQRRREAVILGLALGVGALAKAFLVPWGIVCLGALAIITRRRGREELAAALIAWIVVIGPWTAILSSRAGHFTTGEAGRLTYAWYVNNQSAPSLRGTPPGTHTPATEALLPGVAIIGDAPGTDPMWFDPARWNATVKPRLSITEQLAAIKGMSVVLAGSLSVLIYVVFLVCTAEADARRLFWRGLWPVLIPSIAGIAAYTMVLLTSRYIMGFILALLIATMAGLPMPRRLRPASVFVGAVLSIAPLALAPANAFGFTFVLAVAATMLVGSAIPTRRRAVWLTTISLVLLFSIVLFLPGTPSLARLAAGALALGLWAASAGAIRRGRTAGFAHGLHAALALSVGLIIAGRLALRVNRDVNNAARAGSPTMSNPEWRIAQDLRENGVVPGTRIAVIGPHAESYWARTARLKIVANVPDPLTDTWWMIPQEARDTLLRTFGASGARFAILTRPPPAGPPDNAWKPLRYKGWLLDLRR